MRLLFVAACLVLPALPLSAQLRYGDLSTSANGTVSSGYTASFGNQTSSSHGWAVGGTGTFSGAYYNPNFLSYNASVYLNQSRANSNYQSISSSSGVDLSTNIFGGSKFPGSVSFDKVYNSDGNYSVPGLANYVTHGNSQTFGVNWAENLTGKPSFSAGYQMGSSQYTVYGTNNDGKNNFRSLNLRSNYTLDGFNMAVYYTKGNGQSTIPEVVSNSTIAKIDSSNEAYGMTVTHWLPMSGSASMGATRTKFNTNYGDTTNSGTIDLVNAMAAVHPGQRFSLSATASYSDNLAGQLVESLVAAGGAVASSNTSQSSNSMDVMGVATYSPGANIQSSVFAERRSQYYLGTTYGVNSYGASGSFARRLFDGSFNTAVSVTANASDNTGQDTLGFSATQNYSNDLRGWHVNESFGYSQNVQTLLITYMNSFYNYSMSVRRRFGLLNIGGGAGGSRTALTQQAGAASESQSYNATTAFGPWITASANYAKSDGQAIATSSGLQIVTSPTASTLVSLFGGTSYSFAVSSNPVKKLILSAGYSKARSNTTSNSVTSSNNSNEFNSLVQYQLRKLYFTSGYARLEQGFSGTGTKPEIVSSYYFGISRWFKFF
ncbi:MAG: hypothetical protein P4L40_09685 [Terracidiphilus sp.]|nr:hypothetical protein [Terracidiphilus sp.]